MNEKREIRKCEEIREYNRMDNKVFSNYAINIYKESLEKRDDKVKKSKTL